MAEPTLEDHAERLLQLKRAIWDLQWEEHEVYRCALERGFARAELKAAMKVLAQARSAGIMAMMNPE